MEKIGQFYTSALAANTPKIKQRYKEVQRCAERVEESVKKRFGGATFDLFQSDERLHSAIISYFFDAHRYKHFHGMLDPGKESKLNFPKIYAFMFKWLLKEKPFYAQINDQEVAKLDATQRRNFSIFVDRINEYICISWMQMSHKAHTGSLVCFEAGEVRRLTYSLKFRDVCPGYLELYLSTRVDYAALKVQ
jgi:hypothetical protein